MFKEIFSYTITENSLYDLSIFAGIFVFGILVAKIFRLTIIKFLKKIANKTATNLDDFLIEIITKSIMPLLYFGAFYLATRYLALHETCSKMIYVMGVILLTVIGIRFVSTILEYWIRNFWMQKVAFEERQATIKGLIPAAKILIWTMGLVFLLDNLGFKIQTVIAGLGIGGVAIALASQAILGDLFCYFAILLDRPFEVGDFIIIGEYLGAVEHIGLKTTRIRSLGGEQLVFSNTDLTNSRVRNYKRMEQRRVVFDLGVTYQTPTEKIEKIPVTIEDIIKKTDKTIFDRAHFKSYGDFCLDFEVVYYVMSSDYNVYMDIQQSINLAIKREFDKLGIEFAYPTHTVFVAKE